MDALVEARKFANEPLDTGIMTPSKTMELRMIMRTILKSIDGRSDVVHTRSAQHRKNNPNAVQSTTPKKSRRERIGDMILEGTTRNDDGTWTGVHMTKIFQEERPNSVKDLFRAISETYGVISYTIDSKGWHTFYHLCLTPMEFQAKFDGKLPEGHKLYE